MTTNTIELSDIQGLVTRGFGTLPAACYLLLSIQDSHKSLPWLRDLAGQVTYADIRPNECAFNLAFTYHGLAKLGLEQSTLDSFSDEFRSGMNTPHKRHILGDEGENAPENWLWGGPATKQIDVLLLCYAKDEATLNTFINRLKIGMTEQGLKLIERLGAESLKDNKEHFGFRDSIGQPYFAEFNSNKPEKPDSVPLGEILLGYPNGYERYTQRPLVSAEQDPHNLLATSHENDSLHDFGLNGTYLVFRQLFQDVPAFWNSLNQLANDEDLSANINPATKTDRTISLAAKMVGRWPSGTALVQSTEQDDPSIIDRDDFTYHATDPDGLKCPLGAHIRRTNPRDSLEPEPGSDKSIAFSNRHRILRRGRAYGSPLDSSMDPVQFIEKIDKEKAPAARGLHFICLNANIGRQFEFVQHTWANNPNFNGLYQDPDPIIGARSINGLHQDQFTIQNTPSRLKVCALPSFVQTRGGSYFFLPSRRALSYLLS
ncbi:MAG: Dyp-type peroxidase family [Pseudohongiellaceae bacterium]|jgi:Dyp-type peroxidase family